MKINNTILIYLLAILQIIWQIDCNLVSCLWKQINLNRSISLIVLLRIILLICIKHIYTHIFEFGLISLFKNQWRDKVFTALHGWIIHANIQKHTTSVKIISLIILLYEIVFDVLEGAIILLSLRKNIFRWLINFSRSLHLIFF